MKTTATVLDESAVKSAAALGIELAEQEEWQCCGAVFPLSTDEIASYLSSVRSLSAAVEEGEKLVTLCAACHHVIKRANHVMKTNAEVRDKANNYLQLEEEYLGQGEVIHYLEMLRDEIGFEALAEKVKQPLEGRKVAAYYGCLLLRPGKVMEFDDAENPSIMEEFIKALGAEAVDYPYRTECCGVYLSVNNEDIATGMVKKIVDSALLHGAEAMINACPLCHYNLLELQDKTPQGDPVLPVYYFTELLQEALGIEEKVTDKTVG